MAKQWTRFTHCPKHGVEIEPDEACPECVKDYTDPRRVPPDDQRHQKPPRNRKSRPL